MLGYRVWGSLSTPQRVRAVLAEPGHQTVSSAFYTENILFHKHSWDMLQMNQTTFYPKFLAIEIIHHGPQIIH